MAFNSSSDETRLLQDLSQGSELAFTRLYNEYKNIVYSTALKITKSKTLSEEVVQDVFLRVWQKREEMNLADISNFESYLFISGRNHIFNMVKQIARENTMKNNIKYNDTSFNTTDSDIRDQQYSILLNQILDKLPPQQKKIYQMAKIEGLSHQQIGEDLGISPETVKKHMAVALKFIRLQLARHINFITVTLGYFLTQN